MNLLYHTTLLSGTIKYCSTETNIQILYCTTKKETNLQKYSYRSLHFTVIAEKQVKDCQFHKCNTLTVNLQKFVQLYRTVSNPLKQRNVVVHYFRVEHRHFLSSRKRQSQETGFYTVTISLEKLRPQLLLHYIRVLGSKILGYALPL